MSNQTSLIIMAAIVIGLLYSCCGAIEGLSPPSPHIQHITADSKTMRDNRTDEDNSRISNVHVKKDNRQHTQTQNDAEIIMKFTDIEDPRAGSVFYPSTAFYIFADDATIPKKQSHTGHQYPGTYDITGAEATFGRRDPQRERRVKAHHQRHRARHKPKRYHR